MGCSSYADEIIYPYVNVNVNFACVRVAMCVFRCGIQRQMDVLFLNAGNADELVRIFSICLRVAVHGQESDRVQT